MNKSTLVLPNLWGGLGSVLGRSWGGPGAILAALEPLLAALGAILERHAKINQKSMPKMTDFDLPKAPKMPPKSTPKSTKNRHRRPKLSKTLPDSLLGAILAPFWPHFGTPGPSFSSIHHSTFAACFRSRLQRAVCEVAGFGGAAPCWIRPPSITQALAW